MSWLSYSPGPAVSYDGQNGNIMEIPTCLNDVRESLGAFCGARLAVVITCCLPGVKEVDIALRKSCDFDQPVRLTGADNRAELVDVALRYAWIDADTAS